MRLVYDAIVKIARHPALKAKMGDQMVAAENRVLQATAEGECSECKGTGIVTYWSEITFFEDRRSCRRCEAGQNLQIQIREIVKKTQSDRRLRSL
jgi:hypothetical protein